MPAKKKAVTGRSTRNPTKKASRKRASAKKPAAVAKSGPGTGNVANLEGPPAWRWVNGQRRSLAPSE